MKVDSFAVVMTACVAPKAGVRELLKRADPRQREDDYARAIRFWLTLHEPRISHVVFADNSGHPLDRLSGLAQEVAGAQRSIEFISRDYPAPSPGLSYGHPEFLLVNDALRSSARLAQISHFIKATGRYLFPDVSRLLRHLPAEFQVAVDTRGMWPFGRRPEPIITLPLALFAREFYLRELAGIPDRMVPAPPWDRRQFVEPMMFDLLYPRRHEPGLILRWPCNCEPVGWGANGTNYTSPRLRLRDALRATLRRVAPRLWI